MKNVYKSILLALAIIIPIKLVAFGQWGIYAGQDYSLVKSSVEKIGQNPADVATFVNYSEPFPFVFAAQAGAAKQTLVIFWEQYNAPLDKIIAGDFDNYIRQFAKDVSFYGHPVILAPLHEMSGNWDPWGGMVGGNSPQKVIEAWRHMHDIFSAENVENVKWGWAVNNDSVPDTQENAIANYYPGDDYVDYVGVDGFNFGDPWQSYDEVFSSALSQLKTYNKPIYIFSMACAPGPKKALWIKDAIQKIKADSSIVGWIWFNENKEQNWSINSDEESLHAFRSGL